ncbi:MAG: CMGC protein kinase [Amphiamblys sp. WSBS2006]|nr:MAG: CMGC protein kinase [Amphiamblys sp. WSBS2006]
MKNNAHLCFLLLCSFSYAFFPRPNIKIYRKDEAIEIPSDEKGKPFRFEYIEEIARGYFGVVSKIQNTETKVLYAMKRYKCRPRQKHAEYEVSILRQLKHKNIIQLVSFFKDIYFVEDYFEIPRSYLRITDGYLGIIMEYVPLSLLQALGKEAHYEKIRKNKKEVVFQLLSGLEYIHRKGIINRDIKEDNILVDMEKMCVKICDFGCGFDRKQKSKKALNTSFGAHKAPEINRGRTKDNYSQDVWSVGLIMGRIYIGEYIFKRNSTYYSDLKTITGFLETRSTENIPGEEQIRIVCEKLVHNMDAKEMDLFTKLLQYDHEKRISASDALEHPLFCD